MFLNSPQFSVFSSIFIKEMNFLRRISGLQKPIVRVIKLEGKIAAGRGKNLNITNLEKQIEQAFDCKKVRPKAVVLELNSPGGHPVQSNLIYTRVRDLADKNNLPVISFIEDKAVSGGYWLALAGDEIYADSNSAIGHIGAVSMSFGLEEVINKLGKIFEQALLALSFCNKVLNMSFDTHPGV